MSIYVPNNHIISELRCHGNHLTSSKTAPLCLRQVFVVRMYIIQISDRGTSFLDNIQVFMGHFLYNLPRLGSCRVAYTANGEFPYDFSLAIYRSRVA